MQHRQPRLGDILDDYCPRERRVTNHAVVAMVGPDIKQTRCTTCDAEHEYKHARVPSTRKKKEAPAVLYKQVLASAQPESVRAEEPSAGESAEPPTQAPTAPVPEPVEVQAAPPAEESAEQEPQNGNGAEPGQEAGDDEGPVHRRLIRATLPRPEGPTQRPLPQVTVRQPGKFNNPNPRGGRPQGGASMTRPRNAPSRGAFGRNATRPDTFTARPSGGSHLQRSRPSHRPMGRPMRHGKKSPK